MTTETKSIIAYTDGGEQFTLTPYIFQRVDWNHDIQTVLGLLGPIAYDLTHSFGQLLYELESADRALAIDLGGRIFGCAETVMVDASDIARWLEDQGVI